MYDFRYGSNLGGILSRPDPEVLGRIPRGSYLYRTHCSHRYHRNRRFRPARKVLGRDSDGSCPVRRRRTGLAPES